jgi:hypothetical protein
MSDPRWESSCMPMKVRRLVLICALLMLVPESAWPRSCASMNMELRRLRLEYHKNATTMTQTKGALTFEDLVSILDRIVELKNDMREADCKIPPRPKYNTPDPRP